MIQALASLSLREKYMKKGWMKIIPFKEMIVLFTPKVQANLILLLLLQLCIHIQICLQFFTMKQA
ncbi:uncharacterized protein [Glycine max]|uniref:uncharacterized protein n=1 Tax=Glycine max TaxID=3847 RepID=UPI0003DEA0E8|nr:uncharacterized protein LOC121175076 [Glycine max]